MGACRPGHRFFFDRSGRVLTAHASFAIIPSPMCSTGNVSVECLQRSMEAPLWSAKTLLACTFRHFVKAACCKHIVIVSRLVQQLDLVHCISTMYLSDSALHGDTPLAFLAQKGQSAPRLPAKIANSLVCIQCWCLRKLRGLSSCRIFLKYS